MLKRPQGDHHSISKQESSLYGSISGVSHKYRHISNNNRGLPTSISYSWTKIPGMNLTTSHQIFMVTGLQPRSEHPMLVPHTTMLPSAYYTTQVVIYIYIEVFPAHRIMIQLIATMHTCIRVSPFPS